MCHFDRKNLLQQILEWRNLTVNNTLLNGKISPLRSFLAPVEMTHFPDLSNAKLPVCILHHRAN